MFMLAKRLLIPAAMLLPLACSSEASSSGGGAPAQTTGGEAGGGAPAQTGGVGGSGGAGAGGDTGDDALIVPEDLTIMAVPGGNGVLNVIALTLRKGPTNTELYAALRNDGDAHACSAAVSVELYDKAEQSLAAGINGLLTQHFYRLTDGSGAIAACVGPGDVTMAAVLDLPSDIVIEDVGYVVYRCPYFALDVVPIDGLAISEVKAVTGGAGTAYTGTLHNGFDVEVSTPSATVFSVNRVGRPLGVAIARGTAPIPPGGSWAFETNVVDTPGPDQAAYPAGAFAMQ
ncbi:FxLYD domain-containing protein [Sorangium sp. So ce321]|uniref:FxLYD domain-containing protein n=1 Tax=Sorangium sp. So ce321 TaxID=3133300 RepID=UPI003F60F9CA